MFKHGTTSTGCEMCHVSHGTNAQMTAQFSSAAEFPDGTARGQRPPQGRQPRHVQPLPRSDGHARSGRERSVRSRVPSRQARRTRQRNCPGGPPDDGRPPDSAGDRPAREVDLLIRSAAPDAPAAPAHRGGVLAVALTPREPDRRLVRRPPRQQRHRRRAGHSLVLARGARPHRYPAARRSRRPTRRRPCRRIRPRHRRRRPAPTPSPDADTGSQPRARPRDDSGRRPPIRRPRRRTRAPTPAPSPDPTPLPIRRPVALGRAVPVARRLADAVADRLRRSRRASSTGGKVAAGDPGLQLDASSHRRPSAVDPHVSLLADGPDCAACHSAHTAGGTNLLAAAGPQGNTVRGPATTAAPRSTWSPTSPGFRPTTSRPTRTTPIRCPTRARPATRAGRPRPSSSPSRTATPCAPTATTRTMRRTVRPQQTIRLDGLR